MQTVPERWIYALAAAFFTAVITVGCATPADPTPGDSGWQNLPRDSAPIQITLPWAKLKSVRVRQRLVGENADLVTETSLSHRGRAHPIVTLLLQQAPSSDHAYIKTSANAHPLDSRVKELVGSHVASMGAVGFAQNQSGQIEYVDYTTTRAESCVAFRQYSGLDSAGKTISQSNLQGTLLGTRMVIGLYCEDTRQPVSRERVATLLGSWSLR